MTTLSKRAALFIGILGLTALSFGSFARTFFYHKLGWSFPASHIIDQFLPLVIVLIVALVWWVKNKYPLAFVKKISPHLPSMILLGVLTVWVMYPLLSHYFFKEDVVNLVTLGQAAQGVRTDEIVRFFTWADGYPFSVFFALFSLFGITAKSYMVFTLSAHWLSAVLLYLLAHALLRTRIISFIAAALFLATPIYLEVFNWFLTATGFPVVMIIFLLSLLVFLQSKKYPHSNMLRILSWLATLATLKLGFVRTAIYPFILLLADQVGEGRLTRERMRSSFQRLWPHFAIFTVALAFTAERYMHIYANETNFSFLERFGRSLGLMLAQSIPLSWGKVVFASFPETLGVEKTVIVAGALAFILALATVVFMRWGARALRPVVILGFAWFFGEAIFTSLLGDNAGRGALDFTFLHWPYEPGSKYLHLAAGGLYLGLVAWGYGLFPKINHRVRAGAVLILALPLIITFGLETRRAHTAFVQEISIPARVFFTEKLPDFLPQTDERLMLYSRSTSPIDGLMKGGFDLPAYGLPAADYTHAFTDVQKEYQAGTYRLDQILGFEFDSTTLEFRDTSEITRQMLRERE